jgi:hypothetical protein
LGGLAIALPFLEIMGNDAKADSTTVPKRYFIAYHGVSTGAYGGDMITPSSTGTGYELLRSMRPVVDLGMESEITLVSGLVLPYAEAGQPAPTAGRTANFHRNTVSAVICGRASDTYGTPTGPTSDQLVAAAIAGDTKYPVFGLRVQPSDYDFGSADHGCISWSGPDMRNDPIFSPSLAYQSMFDGVVPDDPAAALKAELLLKRRKSALDLVHQSTERLLPMLGKRDLERMERHFDEIRALELRLSTLSPGGGSSCEVLPAPSDPVNEGGHYNWEGEEKRAELLIDLVAMAFACDLTRVVPFVFSHWKSYLGAGAIVESGNEIDIHELGHFGGTPEDHADGVAWGVKHFTSLASKLKGLPDIDGTTILDNTAMVLTFEGGWGYDPEGGSEGGPHSTENMAMLVAGGAGNLKRGHHISAPGKHPGNVIVSAMEAVGAPGPLGDVSGNLPELFA